MRDPRLRGARVVPRAQQLPQPVHAGRIPEKAGRAGSLRRGHPGDHPAHPRGGRDERHDFRSHSRRPVGLEGLRRDRRRGGGRREGPGNLPRRGRKALRRHADRLRHQAQHHPRAVRPGLRGDGGAARREGRGNPRRPSRRSDAVQRPRRPGGEHRVHRRDQKAAGQGPHVRAVPGPPDDGAGRRRADREAEVRPPGRQSAGDRHDGRPRLHHQPEPRLRGHLREPARGPRPLCQRQRQHLRGRGLPRIQRLLGAVPPRSLRRPEGHEPAV